MSLAQVSVPNPFPGLKFANSQNLVGDVVSRVLLFAIAAAGFLFFIKLVSAGFGYLTAEGDPAQLAGASKSLLNAAIGLLLVITTFFIIQILQVVLGIKIL